MSSTPLVLLPTFLTSLRWPYVFPLRIPLSSENIDADSTLVLPQQKITGYLPKDDGLKNALAGADIVVIPAGIPRGLSLSW